MGVEKTIKLSVLPLISAATQANFATISYYLNQSNALVDDINYAQVTISDSTAVVGDIDFSVEVLTSAFAVTDSNFGMQNFSFNFAPSNITFFFARIYKGFRALPRNSNKDVRIFGNESEACEWATNNT